MENHKIRLSLVDTSGLTSKVREDIEDVWGSGSWTPAALGQHSGELYQTKDGMNIFATTMTVKEHVGEENLTIFPKENGIIPGVVFAVSNDGGKTGVAWRDNVFDAFKYLDMQNVNGVNNYAVVALSKK